MARTKGMEKQLLGKSLRVGTEALDAEGAKKPVASGAAAVAAPLKLKKKRRRKRAKQEIRRYRDGKKSTDLLASKASVHRLIREIIAEASSTGDMRVTPRALAALQEASEAAVVEALALANEMAVIVGGREGPLLRDFQCAVRTLPHFTPR
jgi:histone H3/H4